MASRINIVVAEPSAIIRCGVVTLLQRISSLDINIAELSDISMISTGAYMQRPDVLIVNPSHLGLFSASQLRSDIGNSSLKIVALQSVFTEHSILKSYDEVLSIYDSADTLREKITALSQKRSEQESAKKELSAREKEIIVSVVKGMTNKQIAESLCLSTHTVIAHRRNIANKLQINSSSGLTIYAIVNKLVDLADIKDTITSGSSAKA